MAIKKPCKCYQHLQGRNIAFDSRCVHCHYNIYAGSLQELPACLYMVLLGKWGFMAELEKYKSNVFLNGIIKQFGKTPVELLEARNIKDNSIVLLARILFQVNRHKGKFHYSDEFFKNVYGYTERRLKAAKKGLSDLDILKSVKTRSGDNWEYVYFIDLEKLQEEAKAEIKDTDSNIDIDF